MFLLRNTKSRPSARCILQSNWYSNVSEVMIKSWMISHLVWSSLSPLNSVVDRSSDSCRRPFREMLVFSRCQPSCTEIDKQMIALLTVQISPSHNLTLALLAPSAPVSSLKFRCWEDEISDPLIQEEHGPLIRAVLSGGIVAGVRCVRVWWWTTQYQFTFDDQIYIRYILLTIVR